MPRRETLFVFLFLLGPSLVSAQNVGKVAGSIVDATSDLPLPGATVVVEGTSFGAASNAQGEYFIIGLPVGSYTIQASFVGFAPVVFTGVEINQGYTKELDFSLTEEIATFDEIVVEYERPLIQKDAIGVPRVVAGKEIEDLAVRGIIPVAAIQGGVVAREEDLHIRGGRAEEVVYFMDGVKVIGMVGIPQQAIQEQNMLIGSLPAKYGDAMSGVISITTKSGGSDLFGTAEGISSFGLDDYGYGLASASAGGALLSNRVSFYLAGEYIHNDDRSPSAIDIPRLRKDRIDFLKQNPQSLRFLDQDGNRIYLPLPGEAAPTVDSDGDGEADAVRFDDMLNLMDIPDGYTLDSPAPLSGAEVEPLSSYEFDGSRPNFERDRISATGNITFIFTDRIRFRLGGRYDGLNETSAGNMSRVVLDFDNLLEVERKTYGVGGTWTHRLSNSTFYQLQADWSKYTLLQHNPMFSSNVEDVLFYGDIDHPANAVAARQRLWSATDSLYRLKFEDGSLPGSGGVYGILTDIGVSNPAFRTDENDQFRLAAQATTQIGIHQVEFGGEYERRTERSFRIDGGNIAAFFDDGVVEAGSSAAVSEYRQLPLFAAGYNYWGFNYLGTAQTDRGEIDEYVAGALGSCNDPSDTPDSRCDAPPYEPILYAGYIQDKIEYKDLVLNLGLRVDVFDNNGYVLKDPFALIPIVRAGSLVDRPANIAADYAVYLDSKDNLIGFRDLEGRYYDQNGEEAEPNDVLGPGSPQVPAGTDPVLSSEVFKSYDPEAIWMPRIGVSFPVTDQALFFAHYDKTSQRPFEAPFAGVASYFSASQGGAFLIGNPALRPVTTTEYELGFRQRLGRRSALMISGFYKKIDDLIQVDAVDFAFPNDYTTYANSDFGTVKGLQVEFDLRRTNSVSLNANYTLQYARGTGSDYRTSLRASIFGVPPDFLFPLDFDRRHSINIVLDYRLGKGEGPSVAGSTIFENFGLNIIGSFHSGFPYTPEEWPAQSVSGDLNGAQMSWSNGIDLRLDRRITFAPTLNLTAFLWIQNLLDTENELFVWPTTGRPDTDGYLSTDQGEDYLQAEEARVCGADCEGEIAEIADALYKYRYNSPWNYGIPRQIRLGLRLNL